MLPNWGGNAAQLVSVVSSCGVIFLSPCPVSVEDAVDIYCWTVMFWSRTWDDIVAFLFHFVLDERESLQEVLDKSSLIIIEFLRAYLCV